MKHGQLIMGPAGCGKSTFPARIEEHVHAKNRNILVVNLDPAAENFNYKVAIDIHVFYSKMFVRILLLLCLIQESQSKTPPSKPIWPSTFSVNFMEAFKNGQGATFEGLFATDLNYIDNKTGIKGAEVILRGTTPEYTCAAVNPGTACVTLAVAGQRYLQFETGTPTCCRCCSWANGCGPLKMEWTENATYTTSRIVRGELCYDYSILGNSNNSLSIRASDGEICALDNAGDDYFEFIPSTYKKQVVDTDLFKVPGSCDTWCGPHGACKQG